MDSKVGKKIFRSCSFGDVTDSPPEEKVPSSQQRAYGDINKEPQDYIVMQGVQYKVSRTASPRPPQPDTFADNFDIDKFTAELQTKSKEELIADLIEAQKIIRRQDIEIRRLNKKKFFTENGSTSAALSSASASKALLRHRLQIISPRVASELDSPRNDSPNSESGIETIISHTCSIISPKNGDDGSITINGISSLPDDCTIQSEDALAHSVEPLMKTAPLTVESTESGDSAFLRLSSSLPLEGLAIDTPVGQSSQGGGHEGLKRRLSMNAKDRRTTRIPVTQRLRNLPRQQCTESNPEGGSNSSSPVKPERKSSSRFNWEGSAESSAHGLLMFMVHDNHMLGDTVAAAVSCVDPGSVVVARRPSPQILLPPQIATACGVSPTEKAGPPGMAVMLESKDDAGLSVFLVGTIIFSGDMSSVQGADASNPRGAQCMVIGGLQAVKAKLKDFPTRGRPGNTDIREIDLAGLPQDSYFNISDADSLRRFLRPCSSRVDVILDPSRSAPSWYPYYEGSRKMAPQFRSRGIGYIRLGDDMSMHGIAFLSTDAGATFLDDGLNSVLDVSKKPKGSPTHGQAQNRIRSASSFESAGDSDPRVLGRATSGGAGGLMSPRRTSLGGTAALRSAMQAIKNADAPVGVGSSAAPLTWSQRVEHLQKLQKELRVLGSMVSTNSSSTLRTSAMDDLAAGSSSCDWITDVFSTISESLVKQKNPNVLKETLSCVPLLGPWIPALDGLPSTVAPSVAASLIAWRTLLLEVVHCLRHANKSASDTARAALDELEKSHALSFTSISRLNPNVFPELLMGPSRGNSSRPAANGASVSTAAHTARVMGWLSQLATAAAREAREGAASGAFFEDDCYQGTNLMKSLKGLLFHREESTRESATSLMSILVCYDVVSANRPAPPAPRVSESPRPKQTSAKALISDIQSVNPQSVINQLPEGVSIGTMQLLREIEEEAAKVCSRVVKDAIELIRVIEASPSEGRAPRVANMRSSSFGSETTTQSTASSNMAINGGSKPASRVPPAVGSELAAGLEDEWFEAKLTLKKPPTDEASWSQMVEIIDQSAAFFASVYSESAKHSVSSGEFIRALLPFNESTSSGDQAHVNIIVENSGQPSAIPQSLVAKYRPYAISLRSLIRVKMADTEDLKQAKLVTEHLKRFVDKVNSSGFSSKILKL